MLAGILIVAALGPGAPGPPAVSGPQSGAAQEAAGQNLRQTVDSLKEILEGRDREGEAIALMDELVKRHKANAAQLLEIADQLALKQGDTDALKMRQKELDKEQKQVAGAVWLAFKLRKQVTEPHLTMWKAAAYAFGQMGSGGAGYLLQAFEDDRFNKEVEFRALLVEQIGYTKDYSRAKDLADFLDHSQDAVIAAAARAMVQFRDAPGNARKLLVGNLVTRLESYHIAATNVEDVISVARYTTVRGPMVDALRALTREASLSEPLEWTKWWNDNKGEAAAWKD